MAEAMQSIVERTQTVTLTCDSTDNSGSQVVPSVTLSLTKPKKEKKVNWRADTVDNEHMNKKKSKCCCIYKKPRRSLDSSSEDEGTDCDDCRGHVEKKKKHVEVSPEPTSSVGADDPMMIS